MTRPVTKRRLTRTLPRRLARPLSRPRRTLVTAITSVFVAILAIVALGLGDFPLSPTKVLSALFSDQGFATTVVVDWRLPRVLTAIIGGAALATSGALFQSLTRNPLGSPDIIGFTTGAYTGVILTISAGAVSFGTRATGALAGALLTAAVVYALAWRGGVHGLRLVVVGVAVTAMLTSINTYLLLRLQSEVAMSASFWGTGTLALAGWAQIRVAVIPLAIFAVATGVLSRPLRQLELGDDTARAHGVRAEPARAAIVVTAVGLVAVVTAVAGPIAFIALAAPQLAKRIAGGPGIPLGATAATGAFLLLAADQIAQHVLPGAVPVGVVTLVLGGMYLVTVLAQEARTR